MGNYDLKDTFRVNLDVKSSDVLDDDDYKFLIVKLDEMRYEEFDIRLMARVSPPPPTPNSIKVIIFFPGTSAVNHTFLIPEKMHDGFQLYGPQPEEWKTICPDSNKEKTKSFQGMNYTVCSRMHIEVKLLDKSDPLGVYNVQIVK